MRKAKIILSAIVIFAVAGGAYAVKASRIVEVLFFCPSLGQLPTTAYTGYRTTGPALGGRAVATTTNTLPCVDTWTTAGS